MNSLSIILWTLIVLASIEFLFLILFPKSCLEIFKQISKLKKEEIRKIALLELIFVIILIIIVLLINIL